MFMWKYCIFTVSPLCYWYGFNIWRKYLLLKCKHSHTAIFEYQECLSTYARHLYIILKWVLMWTVFLGASSVNCYNFKVRRLSFTMDAMDVINTMDVKDLIYIIQKFNQIEKIPKDNLLVIIRCKTFMLKYFKQRINKSSQESLWLTNTLMKPFQPKFHNRFITFLSLILILHNFIFNSVNYIQKMGFTLRVVCDPSYANMFMGKFQEKRTKFHAWGGTFC